jgi:alcohol dehydrogenase (NADP+)
LISMRRHLSGSLIGGITETQELLDFCAEHYDIAEIEEIPIQEIEKLWRACSRATSNIALSFDMASLM